MSTTETPQPSTVDKLLAIIEMILNAGKGLIPGDEYALLLEGLIKKGVQSYESHTGQPIDPTLLKPIDPIS